MKDVARSWTVLAYDESLGYIKGMQPMVVKKEEIEDEDEVMNIEDEDGDVVTSMEGMFMFCQPHSFGEKVVCYYPLSF